MVLSLGMAGLASAAEPVRNLILMIGDGMGLSQVSMLKIENGYAPTAFDRAQGVALISTYSANNRVTDSAAAGTALASGCKTDNSALGVDPDGQPLESMMAKAHSADRPTGIVVTCYLQHATPGAFYAHSKSRSRTPPLPTTCSRAASMCCSAAGASGCRVPVAMRVPISTPSAAGDIWWPTASGRFPTRIRAGCSAR